MESFVKGMWMSAKVWMAIFSVLFALPSMAQGTGQSEGMSQMSAEIVQWGRANASDFTTAMAAASHPSGKVPVPPLIDPPCNLCGQQNVVPNGVQQASAWVNQALEPESSYVITLVKIWKARTQYDGFSDNNLTPAAQAVLRQYNEDRIRAAIVRLCDYQVSGKAVPMASQYSSEPRRAYAGVLYLIEAAQRDAVVSGAEASQRQALDLATQWTKTVVDRFDRDIKEGHQYNLCPNYLLMLRQLALLSSDAISFDENDFYKKIDEWQKLLHFDVNLNLHVSGQTNKGSMNADWEGKAKLKITLDTNNGCYKPEIEDGGNMQMTMQPADFKWTAHDKEGDVNIQYKGPNSFKIKLDMIQLNLCDPQPVLQLPLAGLHAPIETYEGKGHTFQNMMFGAFISTVVQANHTNRIETNQATGKSYSSSPGGVLTPLTGGSTGNSGSNSDSSGNQNDVLAPLVPASSSDSSGSQDGVLAPLVPSGSSSSSSSNNGNASGTSGNPSDVLAPLVPSGASGSSGSPDEVLAPLTSSDSSSGSSTEGSDPFTRMSTLSAQIAAHMGDTAWAQSADGKATVAQYKQAMMEIRASQMAAAGMSDQPAGNDVLAPLVPSSPSSQDSQMQNARAQLNALKGNPGALSSPQGQAAMAQLMQQVNAKSQQAMAKAQAKLNTAGVVVPKEANLMSLAAAVMSVQLPWSNGQEQTVDQRLMAQKDGKKIELKITVTQAPEP